MSTQSDTSSHRLRIDIVGSFLRPANLKHAYAAHAAGEIDDLALQQIQDDAIRELVTTQEAHGLPVITDGEYRRFNFMESFRDVAGMEEWRSRLTRNISSLAAQRDAHQDGPRQGTNPTLMGRVPVGQRLRLLRNRPKAEYELAQSLTGSPVKTTVINVDRLAATVDVESSRPVYRTTAELVSDIVAVQREIIGGLRAAGCGYVQIDGPEYTAFVDPPSVDAMKARGEAPMERLERAIAADNAVIDAFGDVMFGMHLCRGNRHSRWHREGKYDAIAERVFSGLRHQRLLLEYDDERSGDFRPLRFVPKDKTVVLGLFTTKTSHLESKDDIKRRIEEASRYVPIEQLALSPQCGFASDIAGNLITEDSQWRKIDLMLETAQEIWG
ncbi:MAG: hypothetical protein ACRDPK_10010 [Carbonactinosporaceae bacterium]